MHPGFEMTPRELIDATLKHSGHGDIATLEADLWRDLQPDFRTSHYLDGFAHADRKFHFKADWAHPPLGSRTDGRLATRCRRLPDHWAMIEEADEAHPFRLATSPSRSFLNTTFNETPSSQAREGSAVVMIHPRGCGCARHRRWRRRHTRQYSRRDHADCEVFRRRPPRRAHRRIGSSEQGPHRRPRHQHADRRDPIAPIGGAAFHDNKVWVKKLRRQLRQSSQIALAVLPRPAVNGSPTLNKADRQ